MSIAIILLGVGLFLIGEAPSLTLENVCMFLLSSRVEVEGAQ